MLVDKAVNAVLAATDLSRAAFAATRRAALVARAHGAKLELMHVISEPLRSAAWSALRAGFAAAEAEIRSRIGEDLDALVSQIENESGVRAHAFIVDGKPFSEIAARSAALGADLIVVGAHGENAVLTPLLGTTAHRVLRLAGAPVLLVKRTPPVQQTPTPGYARILVATDFSRDSIEAATTARRLFPQSSIAIFHAYEAPFEAKLVGRVSDAALAEYRHRALAQAHLDLEAFADTTRLNDASRVARHGPAGVRIREYAAEISADLIAIGSEEVPQFQTAMLGSVSLDVVTQAECDVLLARVPAN